MLKIYNKISKVIYFYSKNIKFKKQNLIFNNSYILRHGIAFFIIKFKIEI